MLKSALTALVTLAPLAAQAEHGSTAAWQEKTRTLVKEQTELVPNTKLPHRWTEDNKSFLFKANLDGQEKSYQLNLESGETKEAPFASDEQTSIPPNLFAPKPKERKVFSSRSPDGQWIVSFENTPSLKNLKTGQSKELGSLPHGDKWDTRIHWHPDSSCFALTHNSNHPKYNVDLVRSSPKNQIQPQHIVHPYDKPGDTLNIPHPIIFFTDNRQRLPISPTLVKDPYSIKNLRWHPTEHLFTLTYIERGFGKYRLIEINADTRKQKIIAEERSEKFIYVFGNCYYRHLPRTDETLWLSERSGYNHLYLIDHKNAKSIRPLTSGNWIVRKVIAVDEKKRTALIQLSGYYPDQDPYYIHHALVNLDTAKLTLLTKGDGTHIISFSPDNKHYLDEWSRIDQPPTYEVRRINDQKIIATLNKPSTEFGTNHRGRDFHQVAYQNLKDSGFPDRIKWMKEAAAQYPEMDLTRVGIYGGSAGGQSSTAALLHHGDFYKVAVSDCGCHDNRIDKLWWNEQWLDWPINESYVENSNRTHVHNLTGHLLLTVGEMDTNVDPSSTYQIVNDLIEADKDFDFASTTSSATSNLNKKRRDQKTSPL